MYISGHLSEHLHFKVSSDATRTNMKNSIYLKSTTIQSLLVLKADTQKFSPCSADTESNNYTLNYVAT